MGSTDTTIRWDISQQQAEELAALITIATKAGDMKTAKVAVPLFDSLMAAAAESLQSASEPEDQSVSLEESSI